jgi:hypothetical protein
MMRQHEAERPHEMRRDFGKDGALAKGMRHQPEVIALEVTETAMDKLGRCRGRRACKIALLDETDRKPAPGGVAREAAAIDAAADDRNVVDRLRQFEPRTESGFPAKIK